MGARADRSLPSAGVDAVATGPSDDPSSDSLRRGNGCDGLSDGGPPTPPQRMVQRIVCGPVRYRISYVRRDQRPASPGNAQRPPPVLQSEWGLV